MKILWVTNTIFPDLSIQLGLKAPVRGGWMYSFAPDLVMQGIQLTVATARQGVAEQCAVINEVNYYLLNAKRPITHYDPSLENQWREILENQQPDLIHIHGTEYGLGLSLLKVCNGVPAVISIQGLVHVVARFYKSDISNLDILKSITVKDIVQMNTIWHAQNSYKKRGQKIELRYLRNVGHVIGRTTWDHFHAKAVNPALTYHFCNESLRDAFYVAPKWDRASISPMTIFLSQASYPIKGLHKVLMAINLLKDKHPEIKIRIAGNDITKSSGNYVERLKMNGYGKHLRTLMRKMDLSTHVTFLGPLTELEMVKEYLNAHVFVCPSSIENSPNSLGEAQLIGVPTIGSYAGGIPDMIEHRINGLLYRFEEVEMLAAHIDEIFGNDALAKSLSQNGILSASKRHDRRTNVNSLISIYKKIIP